MSSNLKQGNSRIEMSSQVGFTKLTHLQRDKDIYPFHVFTLDNIFLNNGIYCFKFGHGTLC